MHFGHWGANFLQHDLCSGCGGGGGPGIHHGSAGNRTLLVIIASGARPSRLAVNINHNENQIVSGVDQQRVAQLWWAG